MSEHFFSQILTQTHGRQPALIHLRYDVYNSPAPASFLRHDASSDKRPYRSQEYINIIITSYIGYGATGILHGATLELDTLDGQHLSHDVVVKLAFSEEQCRRMKREYSVYCHLGAANVKGILDVFGLFQDMEGQTMALVMTHGGISLWERELRLQRNHNDRTLTPVSPPERSHPRLTALLI